MLRDFQILLRFFLHKVISILWKLSELVRVECFGMIGRRMQESNIFHRTEFRSIGEGVRF